MRNMFAILSGALFGIGLYLADMTNTVKVQGYLDFFGNWDPTLAFVMGGAILPMAVAWVLTRNRKPVIGGEFPAPAPAKFDRKLIIGAILFGMGWGLVGLCPGPAVASLSFGGVAGLVFLVAMLAGMLIAPKVSPLLDSKG
ncbi:MULTISPECIES: DUF6691 family protein [unclassified Sulfitobacter]|jgi:uncharacterized membrane protein YedE/YeeE|uniref:DUF6691 family protein n=1 Tax=unclassified Sulfitobacter TaxID=196795 RepID=UPI0015941323|nr:DUF6691 family protein [Sulfitobacter sp. HGT1]MBQ0803567.1 hypothetical protein [Sulfitobacter sp.]